ncbi:hypothetical protein JD844_011947 [Phrynosoma platyrhinos]|uniref:Uncharacterized protein n=1 Tax=Phrynosoma platyrhinos TaxID=52577 RepID=A0ABQ7TJQ2_PHRPL|nr:hypothetical protein JD844_011947 [Phrynosoma platyrhinos]
MGEEYRQEEGDGWSSFVSLLERN